MLWLQDMINKVVVCVGNVCYELCIYTFDASFRFKFKDLDLISVVCRKGSWKRRNCVLGLDVFSCCFGVSFLSLVSV